MNIKPLLKPVLNNLPFLYDVFGLGTGGTDTARYCYSVWLRHLVRAHEQGFGIPLSLAELGPGDSIGVGLAAVLTGVNKYYALDVKAYARPGRNLAILDELIGLFHDRMPIPDDREFPLVHPKLHSYDFPSAILDDERLARNLSEARLGHIRKVISQGANAPGDSGIAVRYMAPWDDGSVIRDNSVDMIIAQAVMEHVDDPEQTYRLLSRWLKPGGLMSQDIDFRSHNTAWQWNGHWRVPARLWELIRGRREWGINRQPHSWHIKALKRAGFQILADEAFKREDGIRKEQLAREFKGMSDDDLRTAGAFVQARVS